MANKSQGFWGLDVGQCALKALRCTLSDSGEVVAEAFDYIEYPKLLSQPDADRDELIKEAMSQFLSRNELRGDKVAMAVSGTSGLSRFFKPPPVEMKRIGDIVKFEARQQIPFPIEDVVWDYQPMGGMMSEDGIVLDTEIGLFAMKRDLAFRALEPFDKAGIKIDTIQLGPLALFNLAGHELLPAIEDDGAYDSENPPESIVILSIGTDTSDLVVTNGYRVWQRNIPLGGNHFTKQLTKELKLTFAKAEHLKRNVRNAEDARSVVQAMRPIFNDLVTESQRSIGFFLNNDRKAKIKKVYVIGSTVKLPGLVPYLEKNLPDYKFGSIEAFDRLTGANVVGAPSFKDNVYSFGVCYGLCLQGLSKGRVRTNLLPREITQARMVEAKKPWAVASLGALLLGCSAFFGMSYLAYSKTTPDKEYDSVTWDAAEKEATTVVSLSGTEKKNDAEKVLRKDGLIKLEKEIAGSKDHVVEWPNLLLAIRMGLPESPPEQLNGIFVQPTKIAGKDYKVGDSVPYLERRELFIEYVESLYVDDLSTWLTGMQTAVPTEYEEMMKDMGAPAIATGAPAAAATATPAAPTATTAASTTPATGATAPALTGAGFIVEIGGYHFNNNINKRETEGRVYVQNTIINHLRGKGKFAELEMPLPVTGPNGDFEKVTMLDLGVSHVLQIEDPAIERKMQMPNPNPKYAPAGGTGAMGPGGMGPGGMGPGGMGPGGMSPGGPPGGMKGGPPGPGGSSGGGSAGLGGVPGGGVGGIGGMGGAGAQGNAGGKELPPGERPYMEADRYSFRIQFAWKPTTPVDREKKRQEKLAAEAKANPTATPPEAAGQVPAATPAVNPAPAPVNPAAPASGDPASPPASAPATPPATLPATPPVAPN
jgi:type IV pilus assembly protein PilM